MFHCWHRLWSVVSILFNSPGAVLKKKYLGHKICFWSQSCFRKANTAYIIHFLGSSLVQEGKCDWRCTKKILPWNTAGPMVAFKRMTEFFILISERMQIRKQGKALEIQVYKPGSAKVLSWAVVSELDQVRLCCSNKELPKYWWHKQQKLYYCSWSITDIGKRVMHHAVVPHRSQQHRAIVVASIFSWERKRT